MSDRAAKQALFDAFASVAAALGNGRRAEIVDVLAQGERSVEEIATEVGQSVAARHVAEVNVLADDYLGDRDGVEVLSASELHERIQEGKVVVLDVRPKAE